MRLTNLFPCAVAAIAATALLSGCHQQQPVVMAPPVSNMGGGYNQGGYNQGAPMGGQPMGGQPMGGGNAAGNNVYSWTQVPQGQNVPIVRAVFDQGGYQLFAQTGETIVVPFVNQNLYAMKFGLSQDGSMYFVNDGQAPTLYVPRGGSLENASAQGARWYPFSQDFAYTQPVYIGIAPSWAQFTGMGWYPGMNYYGGYWGYHPYGFSPMPGLYFNIFGHPYYGWNSYHDYYIGHTVNRYYPRTVYNNYTSAGRSFGTGSFGSRSFGSGSSTGSFGHTSSFGTSRSTGSFGSGSSFGGSTRSFGGGSSFGGSTRSFGGSSGSFGGSSGSSFGGSTHSFGGSSFGGSSHSFGGGSFGGSSHSSFGSSSHSSFGGSSFGRSGSFGGRRH